MNELVARQIVSKLLETSMTAAVLIGVLLLLRVLFRKYVKPSFLYALWLIAVLRLFVPVTVSVPLSMMENSKPLIEQILSTQASRKPEQQSVYQPSSVSDDPAAATDAEATRESAASQQTQESEIFQIGKAPDLITLLLFVWAIGGLITATWLSISNLRMSSVLKKIAKTDVPSDILSQYAKICGEIRCKRLPLVLVGTLSSPCLFGVLRPKLMMPASVAEDPVLFSYAARHELTHYRQHDHIWNLLRLVCCSAYWFHPLVWIGAEASRKDCELSCDERVLAQMDGSAGRKEYGYALLRILELGKNKAHSGAISMSTRKDLKRRLGLIAGKSKHLPVAAVCMLLLLLLVGCCSVVPAEDTEESRIIAEVPEASSLSQEHGGDSIIAPVEGKTCDFDGDNIADEAILTIVKDDELDPAEWYAELKVALGSGRQFTEKFDGWWYKGDIITGDFDDDGRPELILALEVGGSNYGATFLNAYRVSGEELVALPNEILPGEGIEYGQGEFSSLAEECIGVSTIRSEGRDLLRVRQLLEYDPGQGITTAYYIDLSLCAEGWHIEKISVGEAYGENVILAETLLDTQRMLIQHGANLEADGIFGPEMEDAVKAFQKAKGLTVDGVIGQDTWAALAAELQPVSEAD